ncbi:MAG: type II secretion system F family protein [Patescibacteria group bacterium]|nr:type II secretion system F family protein [Patescibacteria group bacterium]MDD5490665.1 type II secretion system F family protein [Patescibacteria group bacterium]
MPLYNYRVKNKYGAAVSGVVEAAAPEEASDLLAERGFTILFIEERKKESVLSASLSFFDRVSIKDLVIFSRQLAVMISAGVREVQALRTLIGQTSNERFSSIIKDIADEVEGGAKLSEAMRKYPRVFDNFFIGIVKSGETTGRLAEVLNYLADQQEKDYDLRHRIKGAMTYPSFIVGGLIIVGIVMMVFVIPQLTGVLEETGTELPLSTRLLIGTSDFIRSYWWALLFALAALVAGFRIYTATEPGRYKWDYLKLRIPIFGPIFQKLYLVRFTRSLYTLFIGNVEIVAALKIVAEVVGNAVYRDLVIKTAKSVEDGNPVSKIFLENTDMIPAMLPQMLAIGEQSGKSAEVLEKLTNFYTREVDNSVQSLVTLIEPIIMVIIGLAVGVMVAAIIMPMYNLSGQL